MWARGLEGAWRVLGGFLAGANMRPKMAFAGRKGFPIVGGFSGGFSFSQDGRLFAGGAFAGQGFSRGGGAGGLDGHGGGFLGIIWGNRLVGPWFLRIFADGKSVLKRIYEHHR